MLAVGCAPKRNPVPVELQPSAKIIDYDVIRFYGDSTPENMDALRKEWAEQGKLLPSEEPLAFLSLSGGGADGAFGAGFLNGWSSTGNRPEFNVVTGVSTGALIAPFAFLGPEYDPVIKLLYTTYTTDMLVKQRPIGSALSGDSLFNTAPLQLALKTFITPRLIAEIGQAHRQGRRLVIGTTNLDEMRPVYWDIGAIAQYDTDEARQLIRDVMRASVSIPVAFPPVYFTVHAEGKAYDEMHVDGGITNQVFSYPAAIKLGAEMQKLGIEHAMSIYVIRNDALKSKGVQVEPNLIDIASRSLAGLIRNQGIGDIYKIESLAKRDGMDFHLAFIPPSWDEESEELFDPVYMKKLFQVGYDMARSTDPWHTEPPSDMSTLPDSH